MSGIFGGDTKHYCSLLAFLLRFSYVSLVGFLSLSLQTEDSLLSYLSDPSSSTSCSFIIKTYSLPKTSMSFLTYVFGIVTTEDSPIFHIFPVNFNISHLSIRLYFLLKHLIYINLSVLN